ncbi:MAG: potassium channel protein - like protein [Verrucomicrobiaceae bacterium]|nr:potassium channel protein - like protein [Verrucomicrobiaceae bacterium]
MTATDAIPHAAPAGGMARHALMLLLALAFLAVVGVVLPHGDSGQSFRETLEADPWHRWTLLALWAGIALEAVAGLFSAPDAWRARLRRLALTVLIPPLRMTTATSTPDGWLWIPGAGWRAAGPVTSAKLENKLALPMLALTLLVLPVLGVEFGAGEALDARPRLALAVHLTTSLIWTGFAAEFLWMIAATPHKLAYCQRHWINLVIILLPLVAFLRAFSMLRFLRAGKLLRAYRLRTLQSRVWRLLLVFNLIDRLQQRNPRKYCASLERKIAELEAEAARMRQKLEAYRVERMAQGAEHEGGERRA